MSRDLARVLCQMVLTQTRLEPDEHWTAAEVAAFANTVLSHLSGPDVPPGPYEAAYLAGSGASRWSDAPHATDSERIDG